MARFTAVIGGSPQQLTVTDTNDTISDTDDTVILQMLSADIHQAGGGGSGALATLTDVALAEIDEPFETPYGIEREMGFDLTLTLHAPNSGGDKEIGVIELSGIDLGDPLYRQDTHVYHPFFTTISGGPTEVFKNYPNGSYSPLTIARNSSKYNICVALCYPVLEYDHALNISERTNSGVLGVAFRSLRNPASPTWFTMPEGATRKYMICFRINDRTDTPVGPALDAVTEWIWTLRGYQRYFRRLYVKPSYRSMGGWDGRPVAQVVLAPDGTYNPANPRRWNNPGANPTTGTGYHKIADHVVPLPSQNVFRLMIWALSGWHAPGRQPNYPFRFATGVAELLSHGDGVAPSTVEPALRRIRHGGVRLGLWWGTASASDDSDEWDANSPYSVTEINPDDPTTTARAYREGDLAISTWGTQIIGLDAFVFENPNDQFRWLSILKARYPRALFVTEQAMPDYLHTLAPTFIIEPALNFQTDPYWLHHYLNPGSECWLGLNGYSTYQIAADRAEAVALLGYTPLAPVGVAWAQGLRARKRWQELGESAIANFDKRLQSSPWRNRDHRSRSAVR